MENVHSSLGKGTSLNFINVGNFDETSPYFTALINGLDPQVHTEPAPFVIILVLAQSIDLSKDLKPFVITPSYL